ncbi:MAG: hypothetical protein LUQ35_00435 [Methanoregula sp.]|nr:hypothetical protein [Methanoregula sp.]
MNTHNGSPAGSLAREEEELIQKTAQIQADRESAGLEGLILGLDAVIITVEPDRVVPAVSELLRYTGLSCTEAYTHGNEKGYVLGLHESASLIIRSRAGSPNPFAAVNRARMTGSLPDTRLETFIFTTPDIREYVRIQRERNVRFLTPEPIESASCSFIQTVPSRLTGNSLGFVEWKGAGRSFVPMAGKPETSLPEKPAFSDLENIGALDHAATRIRAQDRTAAILEFLSLTNYHYDFGIHVKSLNSITSVARRNDGDFAMVFTSGITPYTTDEASGPTELFIRNYGTRVHHMAFRTGKIEETVSRLKETGMDFLLDLVGSEDEGLKQIFSVPSQNTLIVNEYIHRYGGFDGFFTRSNVEKLTEATTRQ